MVSKIKSVTFSTFALGMNTRLPDYKLKQTTAPFGTFMREIVNCDISENGGLRRRRGYAKVIPATTGGSLWSDDAQCYYADGVLMYSVSSTVVATPVTGAPLTSGAPVSFDSAPMGGAYWTDGFNTGYVLNGVSIPIAPPIPTALPVVTSGVGALNAGIYTYCFSYMDSAGRESGTSTSVSITLPEGSSLTFTLAATPGYTLNINVTRPNGTTPRRRGSMVANGALTFTALGAAPECTTVGLQSMPPGRFIRYNNGRLLVAVGNFLYYSQPFMPGLYDPLSGFIPFPAPITVCEIVSNQGVFIVSDQTYWLEGDVATAPLKAPLQFGAVMGSGATRPDISGCFWMSTRGIVVGNDNGSVVELQADNVMINLTSGGASLMMDRDGSVELLTTLYGTTVTPESEGSKYTSKELVDTVGTGEAWVVNEAEKASRRYLNYAFTSYCEINAHYYGMKADGIYLLEGTSDNGTAINCTVNPGRQDFRSPMVKRLESAYMTVRSNGLVIGTLTGSNKMTMIVGDDAGHSYTYTTRTNDDFIKQQRIDIGRGLHGVFMNFRLSNTAGCFFELNGIELNAVETTRRLAG